MTRNRATMLSDRLNRSARLPAAVCEEWLYCSMSEELPYRVQSFISVCLSIIGYIPFDVAEEITTGAESFFASGFPLAGGKVEALILTRPTLMLAFRAGSYPESLLDTYN